MDYRYGSHTVFKIEYHFVWVTKYRYQVLKGEVGERITLNLITRVNSRWSRRRVVQSTRIRTFSP